MTDHRLSEFLPEACILVHPAVASVIPGARSIAEAEDNIKIVAWPIPTDLWMALKRQG